MVPALEAPQVQADVGDERVFVRAKEPQPTGFGERQVLRTQRVVVIAHTAGPRAHILVEDHVTDDVLGGQRGEVGRERRGTQQHRVTVLTEFECLVPDLGQVDVALLHRVLAGLRACELLPVVRLPVHLHLGPLGGATDRGPGTDQSYTVIALEVRSPTRSQQLDEATARAAFDRDALVDVDAVVHPEVIASRRARRSSSRGSWSCRRRRRGRTTRR